LSYADNLESQVDMKFVSWLLRVEDADETRQEQEQWMGWG
jgi:hypothetical protein